METGPRKISAKALVADIRAGMEKEALKGKYQLSEQSFNKILEKLLSAGAILRQDLARRVAPPAQASEGPPEPPSVARPPLGPQPSSGAEGRVSRAVPPKSPPRQGGGRFGRMAAGFLIVLVILLVLLLVANWYIAGQVERQLIAAVEQQAAKADTPAKFTYSDVSASPLMRKAVFRQAKFVVEKEDFQITADKTAVSFSFRGLVHIWQRKPLDELDYGKVRFTAMKVSSNKRSGGIQAKDCTVTWWGSTKELDRKAFPKEPKSIQVTVDGLVVNMEVPPPPVPLGALAGKRTVNWPVGNASLRLDYEPEPKKLTVRHFRIDSPKCKVNASADWLLTGTNFDDPKPKRISFKLDLHVPQPGIEWGDAAETGAYVVSEAKVKADLDCDVEGIISHKKVPLFDGNLSVLVTGIKARFAGPMRQLIASGGAPVILGISPELIKVDKLAFTYEFKRNENLKLTAKLDTEIGRADLDAAVKIDNRIADNSVIKHAKLTIGNLNQNVQNLLAMMENKWGKILPPDGKEIVIEVSGPVSAPQITATNSEGLSRLLNEYLAAKRNIRGLPR